MTSVTINLGPQQQQPQQPMMMQQQQPMMMQQQPMMMQQQPMMMQQQPMMMQPGMMMGPGHAIVQEKWGYQKLAEKKNLFIKQKFELLEAVTGCETENKYNVFGATEDGEKKGKCIFKAKEKSSCLARQCLSGDCRPFNMNVLNDDPVFEHIDGEKFLFLERPCAFTFLCLNRPEMRVTYVEKGANDYIGKIRNPCTCYDLTLDVFDVNDTHKYKVNGSCCQLGIWCHWPCEPCQHIHFDIKNPENGDVIGALDKTSQGCIKAMVGDSDNFAIDFPNNADPKDKALLLATALFMDFRFFEENPRDNRNI